MRVLFPLLKLAKILVINESVVSLANNYIIKYGLLPNDALILATCKYYGIDALVTLDEIDFKEPCKKEKIRLVSDINSLR